MPHKPVLPGRLDRQNAWVWQGEQRLTLTPKAFAVLCYLIAHADQVVTKEALLQAVWADTVVSEGALTTCIREIRKALGEGAQAPQYIATGHRRGYRWMASLPTTAPPRPRATLQGPRRQTALCVVGREAEFSHLHSWLAQARGGERQLVFVAGEAGMGKTTLVDAWLEHVGTEAELWSARGQCIEHYGAGEAYVPVLEALGRLCRQSGQERLSGLLHQRGGGGRARRAREPAPDDRKALRPAHHGGATGARGGQCGGSGVYSRRSGGGCRGNSGSGRRPGGAASYIGGLAPAKRPPMGNGQAR